MGRTAPSSLSARAHALAATAVAGADDAGLRGWIDLEHRGVASATNRCAKRYLRGRRAVGVWASVQIVGSSSTWVWYFKTADVRLFGWFPHRDCFIAAAVGGADLTKRLNLYRPFAEEVGRLRGALQLDEPKFVAKEDPSAVVSNYSFVP